MRACLKAATAILAVFVMASAAPSSARSAWETLVDGSSFKSQADFTNHWDTNYPWGTDHNGSARMNATNLSVAHGIVTIACHPVTEDEGYSSSTPHLAIHYHSGTFCLKQTITISPKYPVWDISGQFKVPTQTGCWPAFWMTGAHSWPPESDFMEFKGTNCCNQNTYDGAWQINLTPIPDASTAWHTYRVIATFKNEMQVDFRYYIDGTLKSDQTAPTFVNHPCWLIIDYQMEGSSGSPGPAGPTYCYVKNIVVKRKVVSGIHR